MPASIEFEKRRLTGRLLNGSEIWKNQAVSFLSSQQLIDFSVKTKQFSCMKYAYK